LAELIGQQHHLVGKWLMADCYIVHCTDAQPPKKKRKNALKILFNDDGDNDIPTTQSLTNREKVETELLWYSHKETLDFESDPLEWWKLKSATYPNLSAQVRGPYLHPA